MKRSVPFTLCHCDKLIIFTCYDVKSRFLCSEMCTVEKSAVPM